MSGFDQYYDEAVEPGKRERAYAWATAIGLQDVDGLKPSKYLIATAKRHIEGEISQEEARRIVDEYYETKDGHDLPSDTKEADKVAARIVTVINSPTFVFSPAYLIGLHEKIFEGIFPHAYCNAETLYAFEWKSDDGVLKLSKSAFDHFFTRARYPFLALSLYNLIPCCTRCNSAFKADDCKNILGTAHPFGESVDDKMRFLVLFSSLAAPYSGRSEDLAGIVLAEKQWGGFQLGVCWDRMARISESYSALYKADAAIYLQRATCFLKSYVEEMKLRLRAKGFPPANIEKMLFGTSLKRTEVDLVRHGKLICDLADQYRE